MLPIQLRSSRWYSAADKFTGCVLTTVLTRLVITKHLHYSSDYNGEVLWNWGRAGVWVHPVVCETFFQFAQTFMFFFFTDCFYLHCVKNRILLLRTDIYLTALYLSTDWGLVVDRYPCYEVQWWPLLCYSVRFSTNYCTPLFSTMQTVLQSRV